jgi:NAD+ synthase (glutamine-hydrolysing)
MKIGLAQLNTTVGDLDANRRRILDAYRDLVARGAELVVTPELIVTGYPPRDLLLRRRFVEDAESSLAALAAEIGEVPALIGCVEANRSGEGRPVFNAAAFCHRGRVVALARKCLLPTYDVFDEDRYFEPATTPLVIEHAGRRIGITICEDIWTHASVATRRLYRGQSPLDQLAAQRCDLMVNLSASPWYHGKGDVRTRLVADAARALACPVVYCNAVGGNDELIFDGRSVVAAADGALVAGLPAFREAREIVEIIAGSGAHSARMGSASTGGAGSCDTGLQTREERSGETPNSGFQPHDLPAITLPGGAGFTPASSALDRIAAPAPAPAVVDPSFAQDEMKDIFEALVLGLRDYAQKSGFKRALVALSGGIDSAVVAVVAAAAFGPENVTGVSLPSAISSNHSRDDARALASNLRMPFHTIAIADAVAATEQALGPLFAGRPRDVAEENIQARTRGVLMMALSNKFNALLLTTGNKSEVAVGYCTLYGDMCGGLAVISDVFKMQVYALSRWINGEYSSSLGVPGGVIPLSTIEKPPSAELRPDQKDEDSLPPYALLDRLLQGYVEEGLSRRDLVAQGFDAAVVSDICRKVDLNEYKRKQAAPGLKITPLAFGVGRRIPIVQRYVS